MPTSVRVAVILLALLAVLLLLNSALTWFGRETITDQLVEAQPDVSRTDALQSVVLFMIAYLGIGVLTALAAVFLPRRQAWARWIGLSTTVLLALLALLSALASGGVSALSLLILVLAIGAITSLMARTTAEWIPKLGRPTGPGRTR
jgi:hypothetical protein